MKKIVTLALMAAMLCSAFVGCGKKAETEELLEITIWNVQGTDYTAIPVEEGDVVAEWLEKETNVKVADVYGNDGSQWDVKLTRLVAGDDLPDIIAVGGHQGPAHFAKLEALGKVIELTPEMLQEHAPDLWRRTPAEYWERIKVNGKILGIPYKNQEIPEVYPDYDSETVEFIDRFANTAVNNYTVNPISMRYVRDDILKMFFPEAKTFAEIEALANEKNAPMGEEILDIPIYTTEDMVKFFYDIKNANLKTEDGKTVYAFGFDGSDNWEALSNLGAELCGYQGHFYTGTWNHKEQKIEIPLAHEKVKEAAKIQNRMILDKVIDPESLAHSSAMAKEKTINGQYAVMMGMNAQEINTEWEKQGKSYRYRPVYFQIPHSEDYPAFTENTLWDESLCLLNTLSEEEVIRVLKWINVQYTDEYEQVRNWGPAEAGLYTEDENGLRRFKDERFNKYFIEGDTTALPESKDRLGLQGRGGYWEVVPNIYSKWTPQIMHKKINYGVYNPKTYSFAKDSVHMQGIESFPPCQGWDSIYADIPEVVEFWAGRDNWENKISLALAADEGKFEEKWQEMLDALNTAANIETMEQKMTDRVNEYLGNK